MVVLSSIYSHTAKKKRNGNKNEIGMDECIYMQSILSAYREANSIFIQKSSAENGD